MAVVRAGKLVRDRIPEIIVAAGGAPDVLTMEGDALLAALFEKLFEEAEELRSSSAGEQLEELADVLEVIRGIALHLGFQDSDVRLAADRKREQRGGFSRGFWLAEQNETGTSTEAEPG